MSTTAFRMVYQEIPRKHEGESYSIKFLTVNGTAPVTFAVISGALPAGATLNSNGTLTYSLDVTGKYTFEVQATDGGAQTTSRSYTLDVYGTLFSTFKVNQFPRRFIDAVDTIQNINATDEQVARHFARLPDPQTNDYAHDAEDIMFENADESKTSVQSAIRSTLDQVIGVPYTYQATAANGFELVDNVGDGSLLELWVPQPEGDPTMYMGEDTDVLQDLIFFMDAAADSEWTTVDGIRYSIVFIYTGYTTPRVFTYTNEIDSEGFFTGKNDLGAELSGSERGMWFWLQPYDGNPPTSTDAALPKRLVVLRRSTLSAVDPATLLEINRVKIPAEAKGINPADTPLITINSNPVGPTGNYSFVVSAGLSIVTPSQGLLGLTNTAAINGLQFNNSAGNIDIYAGDYITVTPDAANNRVRLDVNPGIATINSQPTDTSRNFLIGSSDNSLVLTSSEGALDIRIGLPVASGASAGIMSSAQATQLTQLASGSTTTLHKHAGDTITMGSTVNSNNGIINFTASSTVVEVVAAINDFLLTQFVPVGVAVLTGKALSTGTSLATGIISRESATPYGLVYGTAGSIFVAGAQCNRVLAATGSDVELTVGPFLDAESGTVQVLRNGVELDVITFTDSTGTFNGANSILSVEVTTISGLSLLQGEATITLNRADDLVDGYNRIVLRHNFGSESRDTTGWQVFKDPNENDIVASNLDIGSTVTPTYVSGVAMYPASGYLTVSANLDYLADSTMALQPITISVDGDETDIDWNDSSITGYIAVTPSRDDVLQLVNAVTGTLMGALVGDEEIDVIPVDTTSGVDSTESITLGVDYDLYRVADSWGSEPTNSTETFIAETYRVKSSDWDDFDSIPTAGTPVGNVRRYGWDSGVAITVGTAPWGEASVAAAQWYGGEMRFPDDDFTGATARPASVDYSSLSPGAVFMDRVFWPTRTHTDVILELAGIDSSDLGQGYYATSGSPAGNVNVEVKVPGGVWLDAVKTSTGVFSADGAGGRIGKYTTSGNGLQIRVTLGTLEAKTTIPLIVRVTLRDTNTTVTNLNILSAKGLTF